MSLKTNKKKRETLKIKKIVKLPHLSELAGVILSNVIFAHLIFFMLQPTPIPGLGCFSLKGQSE